MSVVPSSVRSVGAAVFLYVISSCVAFPLYAAEPVAMSSTTPFVSMLQVLFGLGVVLGAIAGTAWLLKRLAPGQVAASGALRVVGGVAVGPKERVVLVDVGDTRLVLGVAPGHINTLLEMPRPSEEIANPSQFEPSAFYARLKEILNAKPKGGA